MDLCIKWKLAFASMESALHADHFLPSKFSEHKSPFVSGNSRSWKFGNVNVVKSLEIGIIVGVRGGFIGG